MDIGRLILFQGDSITDGMRYKNPEQRWDKNHQIGHSYVYVLNAYLGSRYPERNYRFVNRGVGGNRISDIYERRVEDIYEIRPDIFSILDGTNDAPSPYLGPGVEPSTFDSTYRSILDGLLEVRPDVKIVICEPFLLCIDEVKYERKLPYLLEYQRITREIAGSYDAVFVPLQSMFNEALKKREASYWIWDGTHPTENGHGLIAHAWLEKAEKYL